MNEHDSTDNANLSQTVETLQRCTNRKQSLSDVGQQLCKESLKCFPTATHIGFRARFDRDAEDGPEQEIIGSNKTNSKSELRTFQIKAASVNGSRSYEHSYTFRRVLRRYYPPDMITKSPEIVAFSIKLRYHVPDAKPSSSFMVTRQGEESVSEIYRKSVLPLWNELAHHGAGLTSKFGERGVLPAVSAMAYRIADKSLSSHRLLHVTINHDMGWTSLFHALDRLSYEANKKAEAKPGLSIDPRRTSTALPKASYEADRKAKPKPSQPVHPRRARLISGKAGYDADKEAKIKSSQLVLLRRAYVALGSNIGDRIKFIEAACREMAKEGIRVLRTSSLYETPAMYVEEQPPFINGVCEVNNSAFTITETRSIN